MIKIDTLKMKRITNVVVVFLLLVAAFYLNIFGVGYGHDWFADFQEDSTLIVHKTVVCESEMDYAGPLTFADATTSLGVMTSSSCETDQVRPYVSHFGLQARVIAFFSGAFDSIQQYYHVVELLLATAMAGVFTALFFFIKRRFNAVTAVTLLVGIMLSPWLVAFARNMYWVSFTMFLPFVFSLIGYEWFKQRRRLGIFYILCGALLCLRFLNGYEYATAITISVFIAVAWHELRAANQKGILGRLRKSAMYVILGSVAAFVVSFAANIASVNTYYQNWDTSLDKVLSRAGYRAGGGLTDVQKNVVPGLETTSPGAYEVITRVYDLEPLRAGEGSTWKYTVLSIINYLSLPAVSLPFVLREPIGSIVQSVAVFVTIGAVMIWRMNRGAMRRSLGWAFLLSIAGSLSWLVLMPSHALPHAHINAIVFYMPLLLIVYIVMGLGVSRLVERWKKGTARHGSK